MPALPGLEPAGGPPGGGLLVRGQAGGVGGAGGVAPRGPGRLRLAQ